MRTYPIGNGMVTARISPELAALMEALQFQGANRDRLLELSDRAWEKLLTLCDLAHLTLTLAQLPSDGFPEWVVERLKKNLADNAQRAEYIQGVYSQMADVLRRAKVPHVVLKGFTLAPDYVAEPRLRVQNDIDLYCPTEFVDEAVDALTGMGFSPCENFTPQISDHVPTLIVPGAAWQGNRYAAGMAMGIDLHFCLWNSALSLIPVPEVHEFWNRRTERRVGDFVFRTLRPVDQLGYSALHVLRDIFAGDWITHHVYELARFLHRRADDAAFWEQWAGLHSPEMRSLEAVAFLLAQAWFSPRLAPAVRAEIEALPSLQRRWVEQLGGTPLEAMFRRSREGRVLHFLLADSWLAKARIVRRALLPLVFAIPRGAALRVRNRRQEANRGGRMAATTAFLLYRLRINVQAASGVLARGVRFFLMREMRRPSRA